MHGLLSFVLSPNDVKRLGPENAPEVEKLTLKNTEYLFGDVSVAKQLGRNYLSLGIYNNEGELAGVVCLNCYPNIPAVPSWEWDHWLHNLYEVDDITPMSSLWIHYAVWDRRYTSLFLKPLLQNVFQTFEPMGHVLMVCPPGISRLDFIDDNATRILPKGFENPVKVQTVYIAKKEDFVANYVIRRAVEEDNDDIVAIIPKVVQDNYGSYYISEILSNEEETGRQIIVAEYRGCAVGVLCLNEVVNYDLLNEEFELLPYNGLKKHDMADEVLRPQKISSMMLQMTEESGDHLSNITMDLEPGEIFVEEKEEEDIVSDDEFSLVNLSSSLILNFLYEEDEASDRMLMSESATSIESHLSAVVLSEDYQDHLYLSDRSDIPEGEERKALRHKDSKEANIPVYYGDPNAFAMEICCAIPDHENCLYLLFQAAFECFPDRDYIVVSFPANSKVNHLTRYFARVEPRCSSAFNYELYVLHKSSVLGTLWARVGISEDKAELNEITSSLIKPSVIDELFKDAVDSKNTRLKAYTFLCDKQIIGCAVVTEEDEHEYLFLHYKLEHWLKNVDVTLGSYGNLENFLLSPIFQRHTGFFMSELHRLSNFDALFYRLKRNDYMYTQPSQPIVNAIINMVPILPSKIPEYSKEIREEFQLPLSLRVNRQPFGLYLSTMRLTSMQKFEVNQKIVIIGASTTTVSFLEELIFGHNPKYLIVFTNITVVSPHGISYHKQQSPIRDMIFVSDGHLDRRYLDSLCMKTYVHVVTGVMTSINRKEKYVGLNEDSYVPYDYLFLFCGEQFQKPPLKKKEVVKKKTDFPQNVFIINTEADAANAFNSLKNLTYGQKQGTMVVYGHYLEACCCLAALMEFGVPGNNLVYIDPSPDDTALNRHEHLTRFFNNSAIETAVLDQILYKGVTVYQDYKFIDWHFDSTCNFISSAKFESKYKFIEIELSAFFIYHSRGVSTKTFQAIAKSGLVFNGHLVIDKNCRTNDPCIYGAGSLTMYSKKYYAEHLMHKYYNAQETGCNLGREFRKKLVPPEYWDPPVRTLGLRKPIVKHCIFPGRLHYLHISKPGPPVPLDVAMIKSNYGRVLVTGDCKKLDKQGYFRLHLNQFQAIETITCLAKFEISVQNLICLYGKHEVLLNHLLLRYDTGLISDFFDYFNEPWAAAVYHRLFPTILDEIDDMLRSAETQDGVKLIDEVRSKLEKNDWNQLTKMQSDEIEEMCRDMNLIPKIERKVLDFLHDNYMYLPMYAHQLLIRWLVHQTATSPLFVRTLFIDHRRSLTQGTPFMQAPKRSRHLSVEISRMGRSKPHK